MTVLRIAWVRELHDENARLKRMYAAPALGDSVLNDVGGRKL